MNPRWREDRGRFLAALQRMVTHGDLDFGGATRALRVGLLGVDRPQFSKIVGVSVSELAKIETGRANSTISTLDQIFGPFGFRVTLVSKPGRGDAPDAPPMTQEEYAQWLNEVRAVIDKNTRARRST